MKKLIISLINGTVFALAFCVCIIFAQELPEEPVDSNPPVVTYKAIDGILTISTTHAEPLVNIEAYNIAETQEQIDKIDKVIQLWQDKKLLLENLIEKYNKIKE